MVDMHTNSSSKHPISHIGQLVVTHLASPTRGFYDLRCFDCRLDHFTYSSQDGKGGQAVDKGVSKRFPRRISLAVNRRTV